MVRIPSGGVRRGPSFHPDSVGFVIRGVALPVFGLQSHTMHPCELTRRSHSILPGLLHSVERGCLSVAMSEQRCRAYPAENARNEVLETRTAQTALPPLGRVDGTFSHECTRSTRHEATALFASSAAVLVSLEWR